MIVYLAGVIAILSLTLVGVVGFVCWGAVRIFRESVARSRSADETSGKGLPLLMQTAAAISERIDTRVRERIRVINTAAGQPPPDEPAPDRVGDLPPIYQSPMDMETREIIREDQRLRRPGADPVRDPGIGNDDIPLPPPVPLETL